MVQFSCRRLTHRHLALLTSMPRQTDAKQSQNNTHQPDQNIGQDGQHRRPVTLITPAVLGLDIKRFKAQVAIGRAQVQTHHAIQVALFPFTFNRSHCLVPVSLLSRGFMYFIFYSYLQFKDAG